MVGAGQALVALAATLTSSEAPVLKEQVVEEVLTRVARGETVVGVARAFAIDPKTARAWRARGQYVPRQGWPRRWILGGVLAATLRFETAPGQQAQVDFGQRKLWIGDGYVAARLFVFT
jgi:hypothetical protein